MGAGHRTKSTVHLDDLESGQLREIKRCRRHWHAHSHACEVTDFDVADEIVRFGAAGIARENIACARVTFFKHPDPPARN